jgi:hypothetical protein
LLPGGPFLLAFLIGAITRSPIFLRVRGAPLLSADAIILALSQCVLGFPFRARPVLLRLKERLLGDKGGVFTLGGFTFLNAFPFGGFARGSLPGKRLSPDPVREAALAGFDAPWVIRSPPLGRCGLRALRSPE